MLNRISIVGTGYMGLCVAVGFASKGYQVFAFEKDLEKASLINKGTPPFQERELSETLQNVVNKGNLKCTAELEETVLNTKLTFITVGTPSNSDGSINLQFVNSAAHEIGKALEKKSRYHLVVVKSTVTPGTTENVVRPAIEKSSNKRCGPDFGLCMNPEFLRQGSALQDFLNPDRLIIGEYDKKSGDLLENLYKGLFESKMPPAIRTNLLTAELIKYANNAFLATKISFINQIANICEKIPGADIATVSKAISIDKRISHKFLNAGLGYGGSCLPKDIKALTVFSINLGCDPSMFEAVQSVNEAQPYKAVELAKKLVGNLRDKRIAILGLAFKPYTEDIRGAVSIKIINQLLQEGAKVITYDPVATNKTKKTFGDNIEYAPSAIDSIRGADCCIVVTEWDEFKKLKPEDFVKQMRNPIIVDGRRIYDPNEFKNKVKFVAVGLGIS